MIRADVSSSASATLRAMNNSDRSDMKRLFGLFDENKDGLISAEELQLYMKRLGFELSDEKVRDLLGAIDRNNDNFVDFEEFFPLCSSLQDNEAAESYTPKSRTEADNEQEEALLKAFSVFDNNKDGLISAVELQQVLLKLGLPEGKSLLSCKRMIETVDADGNGQVDFIEFKKLMSFNVLSSGSS